MSDSKVPRVFISRLSTDCVEDKHTAFGKRVEPDLEELKHISFSRLFKLISGGGTASEAELDHLNHCGKCKNARDKFVAMLVKKEKISVHISKVTVKELKESVQLGLGGWLSRAGALSAQMDGQVSLPESVRIAILELRDALKQNPSCKSTVFEKIVRGFIGETNGNPILESAVDWGVQLAHSAGEYAMKQLYEQIAEIKAKAKACSASIWLMNEDESLESLLCLNGNDSLQGFELVNLVATSAKKELRFVHDVHEGNIQIESPSGICSELAIPLFLEPFEEELRFLGKKDINNIGRFIGVLSLQFAIPPCGHSPLQDEIKYFLRDIQKQVLRLLPDLEVLETLRTCNEDWCGFHPGLHSASWHDPLETLCYSICNVLGPEQTTMTIWAADWQGEIDQQQLHAYATCGYDYEFRYWNQIPIRGSVTGDVLRKALTGGGMRRIDNPEEVFFEKEKARIQKIREAFVVAIPLRQVPTEEEDLFGSINLYLYGDRQVDEATRDHVLSALPQLAKFIGGMTRAHAQARRRFVAELITLKLDNPHEGQSSKPRLYAVRGMIDEFFGPTVASSFWIKYGSRLYCAESDRIFRFNEPSTNDIAYFPPSKFRTPPFEQDRFGPIYYELTDESHQGLTTKLAQYDYPNDPNGLRVLRMRVLGKWRDSKSGTRLEPSGRFSEHFSVEMQYDRWFLGVSVINEKKETIGVIRMVRPKECRPFTGSDEKLLKTIAHGVARVFDIWRLELDSYFKERNEQKEELDILVRWVERGRSSDLKLKEIVGRVIDDGSFVHSPEQEWLNDHLNSRNGLSSRNQ